VRVLLLTGKGGVGTTTVAAATAASAAARGRKALVLSAGAPGALAEVVGAPLAVDGSEPDEVDGGFYAQQISVRRGVERAWAAAPGRLAGAVSDDPPVVPEEATALPGAAELVTLLTVRDHMAGGRFDLVVVDCGPVGDALRLVALPEALAWHVQRLLPLEPSVVRLVSGLLTRAVGAPVPAEHAFDGVERLLAELAGARRWLTDGSTTTARLVVDRTRASAASARRALPALILHGVRVDGVVANRSTGAGAPLADDLALPSVPVTHVPEAADEPVGAAALTAVGAALSDAAEPLAARPVPESMRVERTGDDFDLVLALPLAARGDVDLARSGDHLVVTVGESRRVMALPSALRRCVVTGARLRDGALRVGFRPDPAVWTRS
jgi:arsenite/tail-anchored protein-transporting ATPase